MEKCQDSGPLAGVRVLDLSDEKASFCSKVLADLGALVLKVETPQGDSARKIGPFWNNSPHPENSLFFWYHNSNKFGLTLDLEQSTDRKVLLRQLKHTDVLVETYPPGYLACLNLDFETLAQLNPRLIMVSVTGFGQTGPRRDFKSCDLIASALGGQMYVCGSHYWNRLKFTASNRIRQPACMLPWELSWRSGGGQKQGRAVTSISLCRRLWRRPWISLWFAIFMMER